MKKLLAYLALIAMIASLLGMIFKIQHWPGAGILFTSGHFLFIVTVIIWLFARKRNFTMLMVGLSFISVFVMGSFLTMNWPGADYVRFIAIVITLVGAYSLFSKE